MPEAQTAAPTDPAAVATQPAVEAEEVSAENIPADKGFPAKTKVADMTAEQQVAYWRDKARKHEDAVKSRADYDDLKAYREAAEKDKLSAHDKALLERYEAGKAEATTEALTKAATAILRAGLRARGVEEKELPDLLDAFNPAKFIKDGDVDTDKVAALANRMAGPVKDDGKKWPDMGQGPRPLTTTSGAAAGLEEARRRGFVKQPT